MEVIKKGKIYPSSSSPSPSYKDPNSVFKLFPVAILALASALSPQDQEVLAYMITRSILFTQPKNKCKKRGNNNNNKIPLFQCGCFDCYTRFWHRWDSSPNRDLIHQVIEAFEDHSVVQNQVTKKQRKASKKKKDKATLMMAESEGLVLEASSVSDEVEEEEEVVVVAAAAGGGGGGVSHNKGLARKVLPDVMGMFNSRLWSLWGPSI